MGSMPYGRSLVPFLMLTTLLQDDVGSADKNEFLNPSLFASVIDILGANVIHSIKEFFLVTGWWGVTHSGQLCLHLSELGRDPSGCRGHLGNVETLLHIKSIDSVASWSETAPPCAAPGTQSLWSLCIYWPFKQCSLNPQQTSFQSGGAPPPPTASAGPQLAPKDPQLQLLLFSLMQSF